MYYGVMSLYCEKNFLARKSFKFSQILRPNIGLIDLDPFHLIFVLKNSGTDKVGKYPNTHLVCSTEKGLINNFRIQHNIFSCFLYIGIRWSRSWPQGPTYSTPCQLLCGSLSREEKSTAGVRVWREISIYSFISR